MSARDRATFGRNKKRVPPVSDTYDEPRIPPQNLEAEEAVLGSMLLSKQACDTVTETLDGGEFYRDSHALIYRAALDLHGRGEAVDALTVQHELEQAGTLDRVGGRVRLAELAALVMATANVDHYVRIVRDCAIARDLIKTGGTIARLGWERQAGGAELLGQAEQSVYDLARRRGGRNVPAFGSVVDRVVTELHDLSDNPRELLGVTTSIHELDRLTRGLRRGALTVLAATTGAGKSALAGGIATNLVLREKTPVAFFSLEMGEAEITYRMLALVGRVDHDRLTRADLTPDEWTRVHEAAGKLRDAPLHLESEATLTPAALRSTLRRLSSRPEGLGLVVVDYLQLVSADTPDSGGNRTRDVAEVARALKQAAMSLDVPVLALAQLNRNVDARPGGKPQLADLKESGEIEQAADVVLFIWKGIDKPDTVREVLIAKNRHGARDVAVDVSWQGERMRFGDLQRPRLAGDMSSMSEAA